MATQYRGRRGVGVSDNSGDAVREPDAGISATAVADIWGSGNGKGAGERGDRGLRLKAALMLAMVLGCDRMAIAAMRYQQRSLTPTPVGHYCYLYFRPHQPSAIHAIIDLFYRNYTTLLSLFFPRYSSVDHTAVALSITTIPSSASSSLCRSRTFAAITSTIATYKQPTPLLIAMQSYHSRSGRCCCPLLPPSSLLLPDLDSLDCHPSTT
ncbi:hypothetical protein BHM03_00015583 [Ensete ventricosum]|nr:hypothetical protein BHM03_00015583 [Ensete ventricosum]